MWVAALFALLSAVPASAQDTCTAPGLRSLAPPVAIPDSVPVLAQYSPLWGDEGTLGVGHLTVDYESMPWGWEQRVRMPLFDEPGGELTVWIARGWIARVGEDPRPLDFSGLLETGYETTSFIVEERREDGWMRLRYALGSDGLGWTHDCAVSSTEDTVIYQSWADFLSSGDLSPLFFRDEAAHPLLESPRGDAARVIQIPEGSNYEIEPLEVQGDWMRIQLSLPSTYCMYPEPESTEYEGWIRWRTPESGPLLWHYSRGC